MTDDDWAGLESVWDSVRPDQLIRDHQDVGVSRATIHTVAPSTYTNYGQRGTVDLIGATDIEGPPSIEKANDYIASLARKHPSHLITMAAVNPLFESVQRAQDELTRAIDDLGMTEVKLYPMYDHYAPNDPAIGLPIFERANELEAPVMVHMSMTPVRDAGSSPRLASAAG